MKNTSVWAPLIVNKASNFRDSVVELLHLASSSGGNGIVSVLAASRNVGVVAVEIVSQAAKR